MTDIEDIVVDLLKQGLFEEAESLSATLVTAGMSEDNQSQQYRFFSKALSGTAADSSTLKLDPKSRVMSFRVSGINGVELPNLLERVLKRVNRMGNTNYTMSKVKRGYHTVVEIKIGG